MVEGEGMGVVGRTPTLSWPLFPEAAVNAQPRLTCPSDVSNAFHPNDRIFEQYLDDIINRHWSVDIADVYRSVHYGYYFLNKSWVHTMFSAHKSKTVVHEHFALSNNPDSRSTDFQSWRCEYLHCDMVERSWTKLELGFCILYLYCIYNQHLTRITIICKTNIRNIRAETNLLQIAHSYAQLVRNIQSLAFMCHPSEKDAQVSKLPAT